MRKYLLAAVLVAALSLVLTLMSLASLYGYNPFGLDLVKHFGQFTTLADTTAYVQAVSAIATAIATIFALVVGAIAIIAVIESERSEHKSVEQIKIDLASLAGLALALRNRAFLYTNVSAMDLEQDVFAEERTRLIAILTSPTGLAIYLRPGELFLDLCGLVDCLTLKREQGTIQAVLNLIAQRASNVIQTLSGVSEAEFESISKPLSRLGQGLAHAAQAVKGDPFSQLQADMQEHHLSKFRAPTEREILLLMQMASSQVGGEAHRMIERFGRLAMHGSAQDRANFHKLVSQLFNIELDELQHDKDASSP
ncbi:MAG TPA: hypothetical protein VFL64_02315 [Rhizobacter sp.]|nr:hypothetical protein [Rhizobacter sp.]